MGLDVSAFKKNPSFNNEEYLNLLDKNHRANELGEWIGEFFDSEKIFSYWRDNSEVTEMRNEYHKLLPQIDKSKLKNGHISENDSLGSLLDDWNVLPPENTAKAIEVLSSRAYVTEKVLVIIEFIKQHPNEYIAFW